MVNTNLPLEQLLQVFLCKWPSPSVIIIALGTPWVA
jgi:hypothetical protein